jgi:MarR family 2-MHQ and catechol resistance regulon transcriptional repressor
MPTKYKGNAKDKRALNAFICLKRAAESMDLWLNHSVTVEGVTSSQFSILECLYHMGPMKPGQLAKKMLMSCGNITYVLDKLVLKELVTRVANPNDRRSFVIDLHPTGRALVEKHLPHYVKSIGSALDHLSADEQNALKDLCKKLGLGVTEAQKG